MARRIKASAIFPLFVFALLVACGDDADPIGLSQLTVLERAAASADCRGTGTTHTGNIPPGTVWTAAGNPHHVVGEVRVGAWAGALAGLTVEPGGVVCGAPGAYILIDHRVDTPALRAVGTEELPIVFTARDPAAPWGGISAPNWVQGGVILEHVVLELAQFGLALNAYWSGPTLIRDTRFRQILGEGVVAGSGEILRTALDTVCMSCNPESQGGVRVVRTYLSQGYREPPARLVLDEVTIRNSGGHGLLTWEGGRVTLRKLSIAGARGIGWRVLYDSSSDSDLWRVVGEVTITGGGSYPLRVPASVGALFLDDAAAGRLRGNACDTVLLEAGSLPDDVVIGGAIPWRVLGRVSGRRIRLGPGATVAVDEAGSLSGVVEAVGTADRPVTIMGGGQVTDDFLAPDGTIRLIHVRLRGVSFATVDRWGYEQVRANQRALLRGVEAEGSDVRLSGDSSRIEASRFVGSRGVVLTGPGSVVVDSEVSDAVGDGIRVDAADVRIFRTTVEGSGGSGVRVVSGTGIRVNECNLTDNARSGVLNETPRGVDARANWWGDLAGPDGPAGDGVEGIVDASAHLPAPFEDVGGQKAVRIQVSTGTRVVLRAGEALLVSAVAVDSAGLPRVMEELRWEVADTLVASLDRLSPGWVVGRSPGSSLLRITLVSDTSIFAEVEVVVESGGAAYRFEVLSTGQASMSGAWGAGPSDLWVVGGGVDGVTLHFNGRGWSRNDGIPAGTLTAIHGNGGRLVATDGARFFFLVDGPGGRYWEYSWVLFGQSGYSSFGRLSDVWVGEAGTALTAGPKGVRRVEPEALVTLHGGVCTSIWGRSETEVYATCDGLVERWDGVRWRPAGAPTHLGSAVSAWASATDLFVVGEDGLLARWDGARWTRWTAPGGGALHAVHGTASDNVFAVGDGGSLLHFDGTTWWPLWLPTAADLVSVWAVDGAVVVGGSGVALHGILIPGPQGAR